jgi:hypothetical protein
MCSMKRRTTGLLDEEAALVAAYAVPGTAANRALDVLVPQVVVRSESSAIRALVLAGLRAAEEEQLRSSYDRAVAAGEIDPETRAWHAAAASHAAILWGQE